MSRPHQWIIHPAGFPFIALAIVAGVLLTWVSLWTLLLTLPLCVFIVAFFRNPQRDIPLDDNAILAPADGRIVQIQEAKPPPELVKQSKALSAPMMRIAVFMNVFNIHVNRLPCRGRIIAKSYQPGSFLDASLDKASEKNERLGIIIQQDNKPPLAVVQIAGLIARRILFWGNLDQESPAGERYGLIRFGSRVDVYVPKASSIHVSINQRVRGGSDILAFFPVKDKIDNKISSRGAIAKKKRGSKGKKQAKK